MLWRLWAFVAGLPLGLLGAFAVHPEPSAWAMRLGALAGGLAVCAAASLAARLASWMPDRGRHLARAASVALLAIPALGAVLLGLFPGAGPLLAGISALVALALVRAGRASGPPGSLAGHALRAAGVGVAFAVAVAGAAGARAALHRADPLDEGFVHGVYDLDARVALGPAPDCAPRAARVEVLLERGARPRLSPDDALLWFDADGPDGRRQVHRLRRASGDVHCWSCDEPGNNRRPAPSPRGSAVVFDTDRHATWRHPTNTELQVASVRGEEGPARPSRRLTFAAGPDDHAIYDPSGRGLVWSRGGEAGYEVVRAALTSGHGGMLLTGPRSVASGGLRWIAPLAWSTDARSLATGSGHWLRPLDGRLLDPATGNVRALGRDLAGPDAVSFSADGSFVAVAGTRDSVGSLLLPRGLGFLLARLRPLVDAGAPPRATTEVRVGPTRQELRSVDLGAVASWGSPTGVALASDGRAFVLGQRRADDGDGDERLLWVELACGAQAS